jgi:hypothetical protein
MGIAEILLVVALLVYLFSDDGTRGNQARAINSA